MFDTPSEAVFYIKHFPENRIAFKKELYFELINRKYEDILPELLNLYNAEEMDLFESELNSRGLLSSGRSFKIYRLLWKRGPEFKKISEKYLKVAAELHYWRAELEYVKLQVKTLSSENISEFIGFCNTVSTKSKPYVLLIEAHLYRDGICLEKDVTRYKELLYESATLGNTEAESELKHLNKIE